MKKKLDALLLWAGFGERAKVEAAAKREAQRIQAAKNYVPSEPDNSYAMGALIVGFIIFIISYIYCIATYGFLFGVGLGWLPSAIVAVVAGLFWPLVLLAVVGLIVFVAQGIGR